MGITVMPPCPIPCLLLVAVIPLGALISLFTFLCYPLLSWVGTCSSSVLDCLNELQSGAEEADEILFGPPASIAHPIYDFQARIPSFLYHHQSPLDAHDDGFPSCAVCLSEVTCQDEVRLLPVCRHVFHTRCIDDWVRHGHPNCPLCRSSFLHSKTPPDHLQQQHGTPISPLPDLQFSSAATSEGHSHDILHSQPQEQG